MSYILDALKKSEAERNRGVAPSLLASRQDQLRSRIGLWVLFAALLVNACLGGYWLYSRTNLAAPETRMLAAPEPPRSLPEQIAKRVVTEQPIAAAAQTPATSETAARTNLSLPAATTSIADAAPRLATHPRPATNEMELANLTFSTHVYASDPSKRAVTLNGRRLVEGDSISRGVALKEITETGVILEVNGRDVPLEVLQDWR